MLLLKIGHRLQLRLKIVQLMHIYMVIHIVVIFLMMIIVVIGANFSVGGLHCLHHLLLLFDDDVLLDIIVAGHQFTTAIGWLLIAVYAVCVCRRFFR